MTARRRGAHRVTPGLAAADRAALAEVFADAIDARAARLEYPCADCLLVPELACPRHAAELDAIDCYRQLASRLGVVIA